MPAKKGGKKPAPLPAAAKEKAKDAKKTVNPLIEKRPRVYSIGGNVRNFKKDLTRFVKWPKYIKLQRQRRVLFMRLKVPPPINQFTKTVDKNAATQLLKLLNKYRPETKYGKKKRLLSIAEAKKDKKESPASKKPVVVKYGLNHITKLVEQKKAKLVVIAHDVDPIELVVWLPALCRKMDVPYMIVKGKARLGTVVHKKTASALAVTNVNANDKNEFATIQNLARDMFNKNADMRRLWGGGQLGPKSQARIRKRDKALAKETLVKNQ